MAKFQRRCTQQGQNEYISVIGKEENNSDSHAFLPILLLAEFFCETIDSIPTFVR